VMRSETFRLQHEQSVMKEKIRDNGEKVKQNKVLPYLVGNVVEVGNVVFGITYSYSSPIRFSMLILK
jgi:ATP-dependent 26S proteasome regulatory subunit